MNNLAALYDSQGEHAKAERLLATGKLKKVALTAAMRKLITILNTMVCTDQLWREPAIS